MSDDEKSHTQIPSAATLFQFTAGGLEFLKDENITTEDFEKIVSDEHDLYVKSQADLETSQQFHTTFPELSVEYSNSIAVYGVEGNVTCDDCDTILTDDSGTMIHGNTSFFHIGDYIDVCQCCYTKRCDVEKLD